MPLDHRVDKADKVDKVDKGVPQFCMKKVKVWLSWVEIETIV